MADHPPLYGPGVHRITFDAFGLATVAAFPTSGRRAILFRNLSQWLDALRARGMAGHCWLDGSFLTEKLDPGDIDLVYFPDQVNLQQPYAPKVIAEVRRLLDPAYARALFELDIYLVHPASPDVLQVTAYWRGWLGFCRDGVTAKGIVEISL